MMVFLYQSDLILYRIKWQGQVDLHMFIVICFVTISYVSIDNFMFALSIDNFMFALKIINHMLVFISLEWMNDGISSLILFLWWFSIHIFGHWQFHVQGMLHGADNSKLRYYDVTYFFIWNPILHRTLFKNWKPLRS